MTCAASFARPPAAHRERQPWMPALPAGHLRDAPPGAPACPAGACPAAASPTRLGPRTGGRPAGCVPPSPCARAPAFPAHAAPACTSPLEGGTAPHARPPTLSLGCKYRLLTLPGMSRVSDGQPSNAASRDARACTCASSVAPGGRNCRSLARSASSRAVFHLDRSDIAGQARWDQVNGQALRSRVCVHHAAQRGQVLEHAQGQGKCRAPAVSHRLCGLVAVGSRHGGGWNRHGSMPCKRL